MSDAWHYSSMRSMLVIMGFVTLAACVQAPAPQAPESVSSSSASVVTSVRSLPALGPRFAWPVNRAEERMTKKIFGTYVTPQDSPVQPEKFTGYHTGIDFELLPDESAHDVVVRAICDGSVLRAQYVGGYGGVVVQQCALSGIRVTVLYGHLSLDKLVVAVHQELETGDSLGVLGEGLSSETDGERPHLHLSVHSGEVVDWRGYVQSENGLAEWIDPAALIAR